MKLYALIVAGGTGSRMGTVIPKQFLELAGEPVLMHSIRRFWSFNKETVIIVVLPENQLEYWESLRKKYTFPVQHYVVSGGNTRFLSVKNGLKLVEEKGLVAIHDGVRPLVSRETIRRCFDAAGKYGNAIPVVSPTDSIRMISGKLSIPADRQSVKLIQTPQVFDAGLIKRAYQQDYSPDFTDDATVLERTGETIHLVEGNRENIKITNPEDLDICAMLFPAVS